MSTTEGMLNCRNCGRENRADAKYCDKCARALNAKQPRAEFKKILNVHPDADATLLLESLFPNGLPDMLQGKVTLAVIREGLQEIRPRGAQIIIRRYKLDLPHESSTRTYADIIRELGTTTVRTVAKQAEARLYLVLTRKFRPQRLKASPTEEQLLIN